MSWEILNHLFIHDGTHINVKLKSDRMYVTYGKDGSRATPALVNGHEKQAVNKSDRALLSKESAAIKQRLERYAETVGIEAYKSYCVLGH